MATTSSIGTSLRTYSTIATWLSAFTTGGWIGECYNDTEFLVVLTINFSGHATGASDYIILRTAAGQGFKDNASVQTNGLPGYNQSFGVGIKCNTAYTDTLDINEDYVTLQYLQIAQTNTGSGGVNSVHNANMTGTHCVIDSCIVQGQTEPLVWRSGNCINNLVLLTTHGAFFGIATNYPNSCALVNNTIVCPSDILSTSSGLQASSGTVTAINNAIYGFATSVDSAGRYTGNNNSSDQAIGFGTSNQASQTYANQFVGVTNAAKNFIPKAASALLDNGATATTYIASVDIVGTSRPQGSAWDIGAWEKTAASPPSAHRLLTLGVG